MVSFKAMLTALVLFVLFLATPAATAGSSGSPPQDDPLVFAGQTVEGVIGNVHYNGEGQVDHFEVTPATGPVVVITVRPQMQAITTLVTNNNGKKVTVEYHNSNGNPVEHIYDGMTVP